VFYAYIIKSVEHEFFYKGNCQNLEKRLEQHNSALTESIRPYVPFWLAYFEEYETEEEVILREKYFKSLAGRRFLKKSIVP
jgi:putative endonuclease